MKFGLNLFIWYDELGKLAYLIEKAKRVGYDAVEIFLQKLSPHDVVAANHALRKFQVDCIGCIILPAEGDITSPDSNVRRKGVEILKRCVDTLVELDGQLMTGVTYAPWGKVKSEHPLEDWRRSVESLRQVCRYASEFGVKIGIEPINRYRTYLVNTAEDAVKFVKDVGERNLGVHLDTYHMNIEEDDFYKPIITAGKTLFHMHLSENNRGILGTGHVDWDRVFQALHDIGYDDYLVLEAYTPSLKDIAWKRTVPPPDVIASRSLEFMRNMARKYLRR